MDLKPFTPSNFAGCTRGSVCITVRWLRGLSNFAKNSCSRELFRTGFVQLRLSD